MRAVSSGPDGGPDNPRETAPLPDPFGLEIAKKCFATIALAETRAAKALFAVQGNSEIVYLLERPPTLG